MQFVDFDITLMAVVAVPMIIAVVEALTHFGITGKWKILAAVVVGVVGCVVYGVFWDISVVRYAAAGLFLGLSASGLYDLAGLSSKKIR